MLSLAEPGAFAFRCTACGGCCNSPPLLSLPELLRFQQVFIGCLAVRRLNAGADASRHALLDRLAFRISGMAGTTHVALMPQGYGFDSDAQCPALDADGRCGLHARGKPSQCAAVPLDPLVPDPFQGLVLRERMGDTAFQRAGCLDTGEGHGAWLTLAGQVVDEDFATALARRRAGVAADRRFWAGAVFAMLSREPAALSAIPPGGFMALTMAPALMVVADLSPACRARCLDFLHAQLALIASAVQRARDLRRADDRPVTRRLLAWAEAYRGLVRGFGAAASPSRLSQVAQAEAAAWLECDTIPA